MAHKSHKKKEKQRTKEKDAMVWYAIISEGQSSVAPANWVNFETWEVYHPKKRTDASRAARKAKTPSRSWTIHQIDRFSKPCGTYDDALKVELQSGDFCTDNEAYNAIMPFVNPAVKRRIKNTIFPSTPGNTSKSSKSQISIDSPPSNYIPQGREQEKENCMPKEAKLARSDSFQEKKALERCSKNIHDIKKERGRTHWRAGDDAHHDVKSRSRKSRSNSRKGSTDSTERRAFNARRSSYNQKDNPSKDDLNLRFKQSLPKPTETDYSENPVDFMESDTHLDQLKNPYLLKNTVNKDQDRSNNRRRSRKSRSSSRKNSSDARERRTSNPRRTNPSQKDNPSKDRKNKRSCSRKSRSSSSDDLKVKRTRNVRSESPNENDTSSKKDYNSVSSQNVKSIETNYLRNRFDSIDSNTPLDQVKNLHLLNSAVVNDQYLQDKINRSPKSTNFSSNGSNRSPEEKTRDETRSNKFSFKSIEMDYLKNRSGSIDSDNPQDKINSPNNEEEDESDVPEVNPVDQIRKGPKITGMQNVKPYGDNLSRFLQSKDTNQQNKEKPRVIPFKRLQGYHDNDQENESICGCAHLARDLTVCKDKLNELIILNTEGVCRCGRRLNDSNNLNEEDLAYPESPCATYEQFSQFESSLAEERNARAFIKSVKTRGGKTTPIAVRLAMKRIMTNDLCQQYTWTGKSTSGKSKRRFEVTTVCKLFVEAILSARKGKEDASEETVIATLKDWFRRSGTRVNNDIEKTERDAARLRNENI